MEAPIGLRQLTIRGLAASKVTYAQHLNQTIGNPFDITWELVSHMRRGTSRLGGAPPAGALGKIQLMRRWPQGRRPCVAAPRVSVCFPFASPVAVKGKQLTAKYLCIMQGSLHRAHLRLSHGGGRGCRVRLRARFSRACAGAGRAPSHQEMG